MDVGQRPPLFTMPKYVLMSLLSLALAACSHSGAAKPALNTSAANMTALQRSLVLGQWASPCHRVKRKKWVQRERERFAKPTVYEKVVLVFESNAQVSLAAQRFADSQCIGEGVTQTFGGTFQVVGMPAPSAPTAVSSVVSIHPSSEMIVRLQMQGSDEVKYARVRVEGDVLYMSNMARRAEDLSGEFSHLFVRGSGPRPYAPRWPIDD